MIYYYNADKTSELNYVRYSYAHDRPRARPTIYLNCAEHYDAHIGDLDYQLMAMESVAEFERIWRTHSQPPEILDDVKALRMWNDLRSSYCERLLVTHAFSIMC